MSEAKHPSKPTEDARVSKGTEKRDAPTDKDKQA